MDVVVRLRDDECGAARVAGNLNKLADAAKRLSSAGGERGVRGLAKSIAILNGAGTSAGVDRTARIAGALDAKTMRLYQSRSR